jgi:enoyl-CoA hydratase/carnithine racemase
MTQGLLLREDRDHVAWLTMNKPEARNALSTAMMDALEGAIEAIAHDPEIHAVVIGGAGPGFCAGHDLKEMRANPDRAFQHALFTQCSRMMQAIVALPKPVIARVHGIATAAGCQLVATCDLAVAADTAHFATSGVNFGLFCSTPMVALSRVVARKQALEMLLTGDMIDAARAHEIGLVNRVVPEAELDQATAALAARLAGQSPLVLALGKRAFYRQAGMGLADAYAFTAEVMTHNMMARDAQDGIDAFIGKRKPVWTGQ